MPFSPPPEKSLTSPDGTRPSRSCSTPSWANAENGPMLDTETAAQNNTPLYTIAIKWKDIAHNLIQTDTQHGGPLSRIAQLANDVIARAGIPNRHNHRPALYAETTITEFIKLGFSTPEHLPLIRAAGHIVPPPVFPLNHDLGPIITDIAAHMAASHQEQNADLFLPSLEHRQDNLAKWPDLDLTLFIERVAGIRPDEQGFYHPDQPWGNFISAQRLVASTMLRILTRGPATSHHRLPDRRNPTFGREIPARRVQNA